MNCRDFEQIWNARIDASASIAGDVVPAAKGLADSERALLEHAAACSTCRHRAAGYQALHRAILAWGPPPEAPPGMADRILLATRLESISRSQGRRHARPPGGRWRSRRTLAAVAALVMAVMTFGVISRMTIDPARGRDPVAVKSAPAASRDRISDPADGTKLNDALASATEATWDLARAASEPAARLSRQLLDSTSDSETERARSAAGSVSVPSLDAFAPDSAAAVARIQEVGDRVASGVRPLSSTARQAFGFLLGPAPPKPEIRTNPPGARGA